MATTVYASGAPRADVAAALGISERTLRRWCNKPDPPAYMVISVKHAVGALERPDLPPPCP
jgi:DNA-binding transcriptional regulator LsrR (DeoR family)